MPPWWLFFGLMVLLPGLLLGARHVRERRRGSEAGGDERAEMISELEDGGIG